MVINTALNLLSRESVLSNNRWSVVVPEDTVRASEWQLGGPFDFLLANFLGDLLGRLQTLFCPRLALCFRHLQHLDTYLCVITVDFLDVEITHELDDAFADYLARHHDRKPRRVRDHEVG